VSFDNAWVSPYKAGAPALARTSVDAATAAKVMAAKAASNKAALASYGHDKGPLDTTDPPPACVGTCNPQGVCVLSAYDAYCCAHKKSDYEYGILYANQDVAVAAAGDKKTEQAALQADYGNNHQWSCWKYNRGEPHSLEHLPPPAPSLAQPLALRCVCGSTSGQTGCSLKHSALTAHAAHSLCVHCWLQVRSTSHERACPRPRQQETRGA
jgi:hypothetical protein